MTATQFSQMLDKQEAMEVQKLKNSPVKTKTKSDLITTSFLDQEAMIPFKKLRQVQIISFSPHMYIHIHGDGKNRDLNTKITT